MANMISPTNPGILAPRSFVNGLVWPALAGVDGNRVLAMLFQLEQTQWLPPAEIRARQRRQLTGLLRHAHATSPLTRQRLSQAGYRPDVEINDDLWRRIPLLTRAAWQERGEDLFCNRVPQGHGPLGKVITSGSTGQPVTVKFTQATGLFWQVFTIRDHIWHRRDFAGVMVTIRFTHGPAWDYPSGQEVADWGKTTAQVTATGRSANLNILTGIDKQAEWLVRQNPHYLTSYPSNLEALARYFEQRRWTLPNLRQARSFGEVVDAGVRAACRRAWNVPLIDMYSSQEVSAIALQCPEFEHYHVQEENVLVEVLDNAGQPCQPGQTGRVVVTSLPNFATPIIRYAIGDYAEVGAPCPCGRGLMVLRRILGRARNLFTLPDGRQVWPGINPTLEGSGLEDYPPIQQFQVVQHSLTDVEMLLVMPRKLTGPEENLVRHWLEQGIGHRFEFRFTYVDHIASSPTGKYEDFRSAIPPPPLAGVTS